MAVTVTLAAVAAALILLGEAGGLWALILPTLLGVFLLIWSYRPPIPPQEIQEIREALSQVHEPQAAEPKAFVTDPGPALAQPAHLARPVEPEAKAAAGLLRDDWQELLQDNGIAVAFDQELWDIVCRRLREDATERGGVALTVRGERTLLVFGMVFPAQTHADSVRCEFSAGEVDRVRFGINAVAQELGLTPGTVTVTWVHTHPRLGVFLSGTDVATSEMWRSLDPRFTPIVLDVHQATLADQIGVFGAGSERLRPITTVNGLVRPETVRRIAESIDQVYRGEGGPPPLILMRAWQDEPDGQE